MDLNSLTLAIGIEQRPPNNDGHLIRDPKNPKVEIRGWGCYDALGLGLDGILKSEDRGRIAVSEVSTVMQSVVPARVDGLRITKKRGPVWIVQIGFQTGSLQTFVACSCPRRLFPAYEEFFLATCHSLTLMGEPKTSPEDKLLGSMANLINEIDNDLRDPSHARIREFFVLPNCNVILGGSEKKRFVYYENDHEDLRNQLDLLEDAGFVKDVTPVGNNVPIYRFTSKLLEKLRVSADSG